MKLQTGAFQNCTSRRSDIKSVSDICEAKSAGALGCIITAYRLLLRRTVRPVTRLQQAPTLTWGLERPAQLLPTPALLHSIAVHMKIMCALPRNHHAQVGACFPCFFLLLDKSVTYNTQKNGHILQPLTRLLHSGCDNSLPKKRDNLKTKCLHRLTA